MHADSGEKYLECTGIIVECCDPAGTAGAAAEDDDDGGGAYKLDATVLTSASLFHSFENPCQITVGVHLSDGSSYQGEISAFDLHYNIAVVKFKNDKPLQTAILKWIDDSMSVQLDHHDHTSVKDQDANLFNLCPGDKVIALARVQEKHLIVKSGVFRMDCQELFMTTCKTNPRFIGGPLINYDGEVIGINFCHEHQNLFLPINIVSRCLNCLNEQRSVPHPWLGMEFANLYAANVGTLETIIQNFPHVCKGVIVEKVKKGSPADCATIQPDDVIIKCDGDVVSCCSEFFGLLMDKVGKSVDIDVMRASVPESLKLTIVVDDLLPERYNSWPLG